MKTIFAALAAVFVVYTPALDAEAMVQTQEFVLTAGDNWANKAILDDEMLVFDFTTGTYEMRVDQLQFVHFSDESGWTMKYRFHCFDSDSGPTPGLTFTVSRDDPGAPALLEALRELRPDLPIEQKTREEMNRLIEGPNVKALMGYPVAVLFTAIVLFLFLPSFRHGFDAGQLTVSVSELSAPDFKPETRNLTVTGRPLPDKALVHRWARGGGEGVETWFPLVPDEWQPRDPVAVFGRTSKISDSTYAALIDAREISGVLRNIWWEKLMMTGKTKAFFRDEMGLALADRIFIIDHNANRRFGMYFGIPVVLLTAFFAYVFARLFHMRMTEF